MKLLRRVKPHNNQSLKLLKLPKPSQYQLSQVQEILQRYDQEHEAAAGKNIKLDLFLRYHFLSQKKALKSEDRSIIAEYVYALMRWKGYLNAICQRPMNWDHRIKALFREDFLTQQNNQSLPLHARCSVSKELFEMIEKAHGQKKAEEICMVQNEKPLLTVRANTLKTNREALLKVLEKEGCIVRKTKFAPEGIRFLEAPPFNLFTLKEFKDGHFEIQDEASQLLSIRVDCKPGDLILDYCGGSGGKTLGIAPAMQNKGQIFLHDIRKSVLLLAKQRLKRAGVQNYQIQEDKQKLKNLLAGKCDWVLVDAPCSGTGTLRRNPDMKWKFSAERLKELLAIQQIILKESIPFLNERGRIVYCTCSMLPEENLMQVIRFCEEHSFEIENSAHFTTLPQKRGMDGFFSATLVRKP